MIIKIENLTYQNKEKGVFKIANTQPLPKP